MKEYIGDGLYVEFDGFGVKLSTPREDGEHYVYLEPSTLESFNRYVERSYKCKITVSKEEKKDENMS